MKVDRYFSLIRAEFPVRYNRDDPDAVMTIMFSKDSTGDVTILQNGRILLTLSQELWLELKRIF